MEILPASSPIELQRRGDVPASMLTSTERVVENFEPPAHTPTRVWEQPATAF